MHFYQDFLSNLIAMVLLGNANNYTAFADVITLIKIGTLKPTCVYSSLDLSKFSKIEMNLIMQRH